MDRNKLRDIRDDMNAALSAVAAKHGLKALAAKNCTYDSNGFVFKVEGVLPGGLSREASRYQANQALLGLPDLGTSFLYANQTYTITGLNTTGSKILAKRQTDGRMFNFPVAMLPGLLKK